MTLMKSSRKYHKWLMLLIGVQFVIWSVTGAYMVTFTIDYIHGDSLVINHQDKINPSNIQYSLKSLQQQYPSAEQVSMGKFLEKEVYRFVISTEQGGQKYLVDARTGELLSPINSSTAERAAKYYYAGVGEIAEIELITQNPPFELNPAALPAWRVNFDDFAAPSIYVSAQTGQLVGKRHQFWRLFDWMFRFHVMDYFDGENVDNQLLFWIALLAVLACLTGLLQTYFRVFKQKKNNRVLHKIFTKGVR